jgi:two-component system LytT family sensor kinase
MNDLAELAKATHRVNIKIGLWIHLAVYTAVNALLIVINLVTTPGYHWFWWPLLGWGIGLGLHASLPMLFSRGASIRQRLIEKELKKS